MEDEPLEALVRRRTTERRRLKRVAVALGGLLVGLSLVRVWMVQAAWFHYP